MENESNCKIKIIEYDEVLRQKCLDEYDWSDKIEDGIGETIGEQIEEV